VITPPFFFSSFIFLRYRFVAWVWCTAGGQPRTCPLDTFLDWGHLGFSLELRLDVVSHMFLFFREAGSLRVGVVMLYPSAVWGGGGERARCLRLALLYIYSRSRRVLACCTP